jgi:hypothetical protein
VEKFHIQYHSEVAKAGITNVAQVRQKRGKTVAEYIQHFREVKNRCYSTRITEKKAVELASLGLAKLIKDMGFQLEFNSLAHLVQKLTSYEQRHQDIYQDKFKCQITLVDTEDAEDSGEEQEVAVAEWIRGANPVSCKWVKQQGPAKGFNFDKSKVEQIFDLLLREKQLKLPEGHKFPTAQDLQGRPYCKWHHFFTHNTNECKELHRQIQSAIEQGQLILGQFTMKVDTQPFPGVNMVKGHQDTGERSARRRLDFSFDINMVGPLRHRDEEKGASLCNRPRKGKKKYIIEEQVRHVWYQRPLSAHLLKKYEYQYQQHLQYESEDEEYEHRTGKSLKKREDSHDHLHCPFFKHCWNSGMMTYRQQLPGVRTSKA